MELRAGRMLPRAGKPKALWFLVYEIAWYPQDKFRNHTRQILRFWSFHCFALYKNQASAQVSREWLRQTQRPCALGGSLRPESALGFPLGARALLTALLQTSAVVCGWGGCLSAKHTDVVRNVKANVGSRDASVSWISVTRGYQGSCNIPLYPQAQHR